MPARILLIDDDIDIGPLVRSALSPHFLKQVTNGKAALGLLEREPFDLCLIDVNLPDRDGFQLSAELARDPCRAGLPLVILSTRGSRPDVVYGLNCGADDYILKPFDPQELLSRVNARLRRRSPPAGAPLQHRDFELDRDFQRCRVREPAGLRDSGLTAAEFRLFLHLARNEGKVFSRRELVRVLARGGGRALEARGINTHIARIRRKLGPAGEQLVTVRGAGYSFHPDLPQAGRGK